MKYTSQVIFFLFLTLRRFKKLIVQNSLSFLCTVFWKYCPILTESDHSTHHQTRVRAIHWRLCYQDDAIFAQSAISHPFLKGKPFMVFLTKTCSEELWRMLLFELNTFLSWMWTRPVIFEYHDICWLITAWCCPNCPLGELCRNCRQQIAIRKPGSRDHWKRSHLRHALFLSTALSPLVEPQKHCELMVCFVGSFYQNAVPTFSHQ